MAEYVPTCAACVCVDGWMTVWVCEWVGGWLSVCLHAWHVCVCVRLHVCVSVCACVCMCVCMLAYMNTMHFGMSLILLMPLCLNFVTAGSRRRL